MATLTLEQQLKTISVAWGRQDGYCFFPYIAGDAEDKTERAKSYREGKAFKWPRDRAEILEHMAAHTDDDLYWCPSLFEGRRRVVELAMDEQCLWADLDEVDPHTLEEYEPTVAWETSPGRYQALWVVRAGDVQGASWAGGENQRMTAYIGADQGGWDTTQLLRIPGWKNHKPEYRKKYGEPPQGKLLWRSRRIYLPDDFEELPPVATLTEVQEVLSGEIERVDRHEVYGRVRLNLSADVRALVGTKHGEAVGDRSDKLWQMERELADAGCTVTEIVAIIRGTAWNKYSGRQDELKRLTLEASKAIQAGVTKRAVAAKNGQGQNGDGTGISADLEDLEHVARPSPTRLFDLVRSVTPPKWLIKGLWAEGSCGFIAGQPKSFKSWMAFDMALSVSTGIPFLGHFPILLPGPVLYIQEEDPAPTVKDRLSKIWPSKMTDRMGVGADGTIEWAPPQEMGGLEGKGPDLDAYVGHGFTISDPGWQAWLDEVLGKKEEEVEGGYRMVIMDPLMMIAGDVRENLSQEMTTKVFKPIKQLSRKHDVAVALVHHMRKMGAGELKGGSDIRGGQMMLGSMANHAWSEDSIYIKLGRAGSLQVERESKHATSGTFKVTNVRTKGWDPHIEQDQTDEEVEPGKEGPKERGTRSSKKEATKQRTGGSLKAGRRQQVLDTLRQGPMATSQLAELLEMYRSNTSTFLKQMKDEGQVIQPERGRWALPPTGV